MKRGRLSKLRLDYKQIPHRFERMKFLRDNLQTKTKPQTTDLKANQDKSQKRKSEIVREMIDNVSPLIDLSTGITSRARENMSDIDFGKSNNGIFVVRDSIILDDENTFSGSIAYYQCENVLEVQNPRRSMDFTSQFSYSTL